MGEIKTMLLEWMEAKGLHQSDLDEMENVDKEFWYWFENERVAKPGSFFDPKHFKPLKTHEFPRTPDQSESDK